MSESSNARDFETPEKGFREAKKKRGEIQVIYGPMFSGKSTELLRRIRRFKVRNDSCLLLKTKDNRYIGDDDKVVTHDQYNFLKALSCDTLCERLEEAKQYDVIGIDEGQFFTDIIQFAEHMANLGKVIIIACLDSDFRREPFGNICQLIAKAEKVIKLSSICHYCKEDASFSARLTAETAIKVIGGRDKYRPVCRTCYTDIVIQNEDNLAR
jgi:thymidine kinase